MSTDDKKSAQADRASAARKGPYRVAGEKDLLYSLAAELETDLPPDVLKAAQSRGKAKELDRVIEELALVAA